MERDNNNSKTDYKCIYEIYKGFYAQPDKNYVEFVFNLKKYKFHKRNLKLNAYLNDELCHCKNCEPYTGN